MWHSSSWETDRHSADLEIPRLLCNLKVYFCADKSPPMDPILKQINAVHNFTSNFF
jgi:hypothetical protein